MYICVCAYLHFTCIRNDIFNMGLSRGKSFRPYIHGGNLNRGFAAIRLGIKRCPSLVRIRKTTSGVWASVPNNNT
jgi:hypothetical protein